MALCRGLNEITQQRAWASSWPLGGTSVCGLLSCHSLSCHSPRCPTQDQVPDQEAGGSEVQEDPGRLWGTQLEWLSGDAAGGDIGVRAW